jgi:uncharacterized membrane protein YhaH (DUF805 family)
MFSDDDWEDLDMDVLFQERSRARRRDFWISCFWGVFAGVVAGLTIYIAFT